MGDFCANHADSNPTKDHGNHPIPRKKINNQLENNAIINNVVDEIILNETQKVSAAREALAFLDSDCGENDLYQVEEMSLDKTKDKL